MVVFLQTQLAAPNRKVSRIPGEGTVALNSIGPESGEEACPLYEEGLVLSVSLD